MITPACRKSFLDFFTGMERDAQPVHYIFHNRFSKWLQCLSVLVQAGIIRKSGHIATSMQCDECNHPVSIENEGHGFFYQCFQCGLMLKLSEEQVGSYESSLNLVADFLNPILRLEAERKIKKAGIVICLGKMRAHNGECNVFLVKGISDEESQSEIFRLCQPTNARTHSLVLSLHGEEVPTKSSRVVQIPLADLLHVTAGQLTILTDRIPLLLSGVYAESKGTTSIEAEKIFETRLIGEIESGRVKRGEKEKWKGIAKRDYNLTGRRFQKIWKENAPEELRRGGRPVEG